MYNHVRSLIYRLAFDAGTFPFCAFLIRRTCFISLNLLHLLEQAFSQTVSTNGNFFYLAYVGQK